MGPGVNTFQWCIPTMVFSCGDLYSPLPVGCGGSDDYSILVFVVRQVMFSGGHILFSLAVSHRS